MAIFENKDSATVNLFAAERTTAASFVDTIMAVAPTVLATMAVEAAVTMANVHNGTHLIIDAQHPVIL